MRSVLRTSPTGRLPSRAALLAITLLGAAITGAGIARGADPDGFAIDVMVSGLAGPVALAAAPDGRIYIAERQSFRIRAIEQGELLPEPVVTLAGISAGERGLLGLAADPLPELSAEPGDPGSTVLYAYYTPSADRARIVRITLPPDRGAGGASRPRIETIADDLPAGPSHNGGALAIGPDRCLYFSIGDLGDADGTLPSGSRTGRIHRLALDGTIPADNPWPGRSEYCRGVRNCFGLALLPTPEGGAALYLTDNGTAENDEVNRAAAGAHLGWPDAAGASGRADRVDPLRTWSPTTAPVGIVAYLGRDFPPEYRGDLFFGEYVTGRIMRLGLDPAGAAVTGEEIFLDRAPAPVYALAVAADGALWFTAGDSAIRVRRARASTFIRGDIDGNRRVERGDVAALLAHLYSGADLPCPAAADADGNGAVDAADAVTLFQFTSGDLPELPPPFPECGRPRDERLPCPAHPACP